MAWEQLWTAAVPEVERLERIAWVGARRLVECYHRSLQPDWQWFESRLAYANAVLPHALFLAGRRWPNEAFLEVAEASFAFLDRVTTAPLLAHGPRAQGEGTEIIFWPIGNNGWYKHGDAKASYDQQPVEAVTMAEAALAAFAMHNDVKHLATFRRAHAWFRGQNSLRQPLVQERLGACCDALQPSGVNRNQGAESTLAYLWTEVHNFELQQALGDNRPTAASA